MHRLPSSPPTSGGNDVAMTIGQRLLIFALSAIVAAWTLVVAVPVIIRDVSYAIGWWFQG